MKTVHFFSLFFLLLACVIKSSSKVSFKQNAEAKFVELKQVEGSNAGGTTTTPYRDLAEWFSEPIFSRPTEQTEIKDPMFYAKPLDVPTQAAPAPQVKVTAAASKSAPMGQMGGFSLGGGPSKQDQSADQNDALRLGIMQQGAIGRKSAETSRADKEKQLAQLRAKMAASKRRRLLNRRQPSSHRATRTITID